jgi:uncharacterized protein YjbJ (UPF0337 family)
MSPTGVTVTTSSTWMTEHVKFNGTSARRRRPSAERWAGWYIPGRPRGETRVPVGLRSTTRSSPWHGWRPGLKGLDVADDNADDIADDIAIVAMQGSARSLLTHAHAHAEQQFGRARAGYADGTVPSTMRESPVGTDDKVENEFEEKKGAAKEWIGEKTDNPDLAEEGRDDQATAGVKQAGEHVKDAAKDVKDALTD